MTRHAAKYCVAIAQQATWNPSMIGQYRVIRGDGHEIATGREDLDEFTLEHAARDSLNLTPSERAALASIARWHGHR